MTDLDNAINSAIGIYHEIKINGITVQSDLPEPIKDGKCQGRELISDSNYMKFNGLEFECISYTDKTSIKERIFCDSKTECLNINGFIENVGDLILIKKPFILCMIDIDDFKSINDTYGHSVGDEIISSVANCFRSNFKKNDLIARFGGDEFVLAFPDMDFETAKNRIEEIKLYINSGIHISDGEIIKIGLSIGLIQYNYNLTYDDNFNYVDELSYCSKNNGKNKIVTSLNVDKIKKIGTIK